MKETKNKKKIHAAHMPEVDALLEEAGSLSPESVSFDRAESSTTTVTRRKAPAKSKRGKGAAVAVVCVLVLLVIGAVVVAEPWVPAVKETYVDPAVKELPKRTLTVDENYIFEINLAENEKIAAVELSDPDILELADNKASVTAKGEYFRTTVSITTTEIELPDYEYAHEMIVFGKNFSRPYDNLRIWLRNLLGIEKKTQARTELRVLARYTQTITVHGLDAVMTMPDAEIAAYLQNGVTLEVPVGEGEDIVLRSYNDTTATVSLGKIENGAATFTVTGAADTKTKVSATVGFWKEVSPAVYTEYLAAADGTVAATAEPRENWIFVPVRSTIFNIAVIDLDKPIVSTDLDEDGARVYPEDGHYQDTAKQLLELINKLRADNGLAALSWSDSLFSGARARAIELTEVYSYNRPDGAAGTTAAEGAKAQCISAGYLTAQEVFDCWKACEAMQAAMLSADYTSFGGDYFRHADDVYNNYWCGLFG